MAFQSQRSGSRDRILSTKQAAVGAALCSVINRIHTAAVGCYVTGAGENWSVLSHGSTQGDCVSWEKCELGEGCGRVIVIDESDCLSVMNERLEAQVLHGKAAPADQRLSDVAYHFVEPHCRYNSAQQSTVCYERGRRPSEFIVN